MDLSVVLILKLSEIGWRGNLPKDLPQLFDWLYKEYLIVIEEKKPGSGSWCFYFEGYLVSRYYNVKDPEDIIKYILPDVTLLWKCKEGVLSGPSLENYEEPVTDWS